VNNTVRKITPWIVFWLMLIAVAVYLNYRLSQSDSALFYGNVPPVPILANPLLLTRGLFISLLFVSIIACGAAFPITVSRWSNAVGIPGLIFGVSLVVASVAPGRGNLNVRDEERAPDRSASEKMLAYAVFFNNRDHMLAKDSLSQLKRNVDFFQTCGSGKLYIRGFASSARFSTAIGDSDELNKNLANDRALEIQKFLDETLHVQSYVANTWDSYTDMEAERRILDTDVLGNRLKDREAMNRRAEIFWLSNNCVPSVVEFTNPSKSLKPRDQVLPATK
jgi:hypothetical protein